MHQPQPLEFGKGALERCVVETQIVGDIAVGQAVAAEQIGVRAAEQVDGEQPCLDAQRGDLGLLPEAGVDAAVVPHRRPRAGAGG
ncbi:hypothetical protein CKO17_16510 [Marichromatium gracile]|nr:hypothetical protein [Marichromatium gracile]